MSAALPWMRHALFAAACLAIAACESPSAETAAPLPPAGGLTALPEEVWEAVPLANSGFEEAWTGWGPKGADAFSIAETAAHSGKAAVRLDCGATTKYYPSVRQTFPAAGPGIYRLRFWVKTQGVGASDKAKAAAGARVSIEYQLQSGQRAWDASRVFHGTEDWQAEMHEALIPSEMKPGTLSVSVTRYGIPGSGEALFDDFVLERRVPPPVEAFLEYPNYRGYLPADGPQKVRLWVRVNAEKAAGPGSVEVTAADGRRIAAAPLDAARKEQTVELDAAAWTPGRYLVTAQLGAYKYPAYAVQKITADERKRIPVWFDEWQVAHVEGKPMFPIGLYNTTVKFATIDDGEIERLRKMAEAPVNFNINYFVWSNDTATQRRYLAAMQEHGIWFLYTVNNVFPDPKSSWDFPILKELLPEAGGKLATQEVTNKYLARLAETMSGMPGHGGWYVMDERSFEQVPRTFHQYTVLRRADPGHPTFAVSNKPRELECWRDAVDVLGMDPYPLFNMKAGQPLSLAAEWTKASAAATRGRRPVWMVIQFFQGWSTDRWPAEDELRTMSLMAIAEGARGLFYWSFGSRALLSVGEAKREEYWQRLAKVMKELKSIEPALVAPDAPAAVKEVSDGRVRWRARATGGKTYVFTYMRSDRFVADPASAPPVEVRFTMHDGRVVTRNLRPDSADWFSVPVEK